MFSGGNKLQDVNRLEASLGSDRIPRRRSASFCGALVTTSKTSSGRDWQSCGTRRRRRMRSRCCESGAGSDAGLGRRSMKCMGRRRKGRTLRLQRVRRDPGGDRRCAVSGAAGRLSAHQLRDQGSAAGNDRTGEQALSGGADARRQRLLQPSVGEDMRAWSSSSSPSAQESDERRVQDSNWKSFADRDLQSGPAAAPAASEPKRKIAIRRKPNSRFKGAPEIAGMMFKPKSWNKARRYVIGRRTRTTSNCTWTTGCAGTCTGSW